MLLSAVLDAYALHRSIRPDSLYQLSRTAAIFGEHLERPATAQDLTPDVVSGWIRWMEDGRYAKRSISGHRGNLLTVWRFASRRKWSGPVDDVRPAPRPEPMPEAWTLDEVRRLIAACDEIRQTIRGIWMPDYLSALIRAAYQSCLRRSDLWRLPRERIHADGSLMIRQHKTSRPVVRWVEPETAADILRLPGALPLAWPGNPRGFYDVMETLCRLAGVRRGALQQLRRTGATWIAVEGGIEAAREALGHGTEGMWKHYVDRRIAAPKKRLPPRVG
jgi:integrase